MLSGDGGVVSERGVFLIILYDYLLRKMVTNNNPHIFILSTVCVGADSKGVKLYIVWYVYTMLIVRSY